MASSYIEYWEEVLADEQRQASELRSGMFRITNGEGRDLIPEMIAAHERNAVMAALTLNIRRGIHRAS
jgi:hypothetical protein